MPWNGKLPVLNLLTGQKSGFSPCRGDSLHRCQTWQGRRARGSAWLCKILPQSPQGVGMRPQNIKNFHFLVKSSPTGRLPWPISKIFRGFYTPNYPSLVFQISCDSHHRLRSYWGETARPSIRPNFSVHPVGKIMHWIKNRIKSFLMTSTSSITMQSLGKIIQRCRCENMVFVCFFVIFCHARRPARCSFDGDIFWTGVVSRFTGRFWCCFYRFQHWLPFQMH